jgi:hypothetical protein
MEHIKYTKAGLIVLFLLAIHNDGLCQIDAEGKKFLEDFYYKLPTRAFKIESMNILKSQDEKFYSIKAAGVLDPDALDAAPKSHTYINLNEYQKAHDNSIQLLQFYDEKTKKSTAKRIIVLNEDSYSNFNSLVSLFKSISYSDRDAKCKPDEPLCQRVHIFFDSKAKETESYPFIVVQMTQLYSGDTIKGKYQLIITLIESNLSSK